MPQEPMPEADRQAQIETLAEWLRETVKKFADKNGDDAECNAIVTAHEDGAIIAEINVAEMPQSHALAAAVFESAERDASSLDGKRTYHLSLSDVPGRCPLVFGSDDDLEEEEDEDERLGGLSRFASGGGGMMSPRGVPVEGWVKYSEQRDKHEQVLLSSLLKQQDMMYRLMSKTITEQNETIRAHEKQRAQERLVVEELYSQKHLRDLDLRKLEKDEARKDEAINMLKPFGMSIAARMMGPKAIPAEASPMLTMINEMMSSFTPEQFNELMANDQLKLSPAQKRSLLEVFSVVQSLEEQKAAASAPAPVQIPPMQASPAAPPAHPTPPPSTLPSTKAEGRKSSAARAARSKKEKGKGKEAHA